MLPTPRGAISKGVINDSELVIDLLKDIRQEYKWHGNRINLCLDSRLCYLRPVIVPEMSKRNLLGAMRLEAEKHFSVNPDQSVISYALMQRGNYYGKPACRYLLAATHKKFSDAYTMAAVKAGFNPVSLEISALSMLRSLNHVNRYDQYHPDTTQIFINCGNESTTLLMANKDKYLFHRCIFSGLDHFVKTVKIRTAQNNSEAQQLLYSNKTLSEKGVLDLASKLAYSIKQSFDYYYDNNLSERTKLSCQLMVSGGGIFIPGLASHLQNRLNMKLILHNPLQYLSYQHKTNQNSTEHPGALFAASYGLALRGWLN